MILEIKRKDNNVVIPEYATEGSAAMDLVANEFISKYNDMNRLVPEEHMNMHKETIHVHSGERLLVGTGLYVAIPKGYVADIRPRSGRALKEGLDVANSPGTIDSDYRGEVCVILTNHSHVPVDVKRGDKIAQMIILKHQQADIVLVDNLPDTERGEGGFGSTGK